MLRSIAFGLFSALGLLSSAIAAPVNFDIPTQPAPAALDLFIKQSGAQVVYLLADVKDARTNAVKGTYEPAIALDLALKDTGLSFTERKPGQFSVGRVAPKVGSVRGSLMLPGGGPAAGVLVVVHETGQSVETDKDGQFLFNAVAPGSHVLVASAEGYQPLHITDVVVRAGNELALSRERLHKPADSLTVLEPFVVRGQALTELDKYSVYGSKQKPFEAGNMDIPRSINDAKPFYMFEASVIEQSGATTVEEFLSLKLTMASNYRPATRASVGGTNDFMGTAGSMQMRGLSPSQTVILLNGRRLPNVNSGGTDAPPDLNSIPVSLIDHIEVLPSSASGIYGGGAVGGVVNIITKRDYAGGELRLTYDNTFKSDSAKLRADLNYGMSLAGGRTNLMLSASSEGGNPLTVGDREELIRESWARIAVNNPSALTFANVLFGTTPRIDSQNFVPLVFKAQYGGQPLGSNFLFVPAGYRGLGTDGVAGLVANVGRLDTVWPDSAQAYNGTRYRIYNLPRTRSLRAELRQKITPWLEAFLESSYSENTNSTLWSALANTVTIPAAAPTNPFNQTIMVRYPGAYDDRRIHTPQIRRQVVAGFSAKLPHDWLVLADYAWNRNSVVAEGPRGSIPAAVIAAGTLDFLADPRIAPLNLAPYIATNYYSSASSMREANLRGAGPLPRVFGLRPSLALGIQARNEERDPYTAATVYPNNSALNTYIGSFGGSQKANGYYGELTLPLVNPESARPGLRLLDIQIAARRDECTLSQQRDRTTGATFFSGSGALPATLPASTEPSVSYAATTPTYGLRYKPVEDIMLRTSFAKGYLPPTSSQLIQGIPGTVPSTVFDPRRGGSAVSIIPDPVGGNPNVTPETSSNWTAGVVFTPQFLPGLRLAVDYTFIKKENNIASLSAQQLANNETVFPGRVQRGPVPSGDPYGVGPITGIDITAVNLFSTTIEAYDVSLSYQKATAAYGTFVFDALATIQQHYLQRITLGAPEIEYVGVPYFAGGPLKLRGNISVTWTFRQWQAGWTTTYYDHYKVVGPPFLPTTTFLLNNGGDTVPSQAYHDVFARYRFGEQKKAGNARRLLANTELLVGVRNVFNQAPPFDGQAGNTNFYRSPYGDLRLASYYVTIKKKL
jgi:iron complex outermembrane receptor protein